MMTIQAGAGAEAEGARAAAAADMAVGECIAG